MTIKFPHSMIFTAINMLERINKPAATDAQNRLLDVAGKMKNTGSVDSGYCGTVFTDAADCLIKNATPAREEIAAELYQLSDQLNNDGEINFG